MGHSLDEGTEREILALAKRRGLKKVILFGSRARRTHRKRSDIDLAVRGGDVAGFSVDLEEFVSTLLKFDVVNLGEKISEELREEIRRDGVVLYEETKMRKYVAFENCLAVLLKADRSQAEQDEIYRMGIIGQFNLAFELAWKAIKETLLLHGVAEGETGSPHDTLKSAYAIGWLSEERIWLDMLKKRNIAVHVYDEEKALELVNLIFDSYLGALTKLGEELKKRADAVRVSP